MKTIATPDAAAAALLKAVDFAMVLPGMSAQDQVTMATALSRNEPYRPGADAVRREGIGRGTVSQHRFSDSRSYPGTARDWWLYIPSSTASTSPANLMVFQDGGRYLGPEIDAPAVFDNLIAAGEIPPTIGLFINPGDTGPGLPLWGGVDNRSIEYDSLGDAYARFLIEEMIPPVAAQHAVASDPAQRAICGLSSGGICAFNAAWERPDSFGGVISHCGSFVDIRGGHAMASKVRRGPARALRVFLQTGTQDLDVVFGHWVNANRDLAAALAYQSIDHQLVIGEGAHSLKHGGALFPDTLRWLWRTPT
jgi:enterochelin esterase-like enzyme